MTTRDETRQILGYADVMQAFVDGKQIQCNAVGNPPDMGWRNISGDPNWASKCVRYRVVPSPREWWAIRPCPCAMFGNKEAAECFIAKNSIMRGSEVVHVREVLDE